MALHIQHNAPWVNVTKDNIHSRELTLDHDEQRVLLEVLAEAHGMTLVGTEQFDRMLARTKPVEEARRVDHYLAGRKMHHNSDQQDIHGLAVKGDNELRMLTVSDLRALVDFVKEA